MKFGYIRRDDSAHNYLIPEALIVEFDAFMDAFHLAAPYRNKFYELCDVFEERYGQYRIDGTENLRVIIDDS